MLRDIGQGWPLAGVLAGAGDDASRVIEALAKYVPPARVAQVLAQTGRVERRRRKLPAAAVVWLVVLMGLRADLDLVGLWRQVCGVLASMLAMLAGARPVAKSALSRARARLGARPLRQLMLASGRSLPATPGASYKGMRLVATDGDDYLLPDTPANARAFGRPSTARDGVALAGGYPQLHLTRLMDVGTRVTIEAVVKPHATADHDVAPRLLDAAGAGDLLLWDCGFYSFALMRRAIGQGKHFLGPVPAHVVLDPVRRLADGSYLAKVYPSPNDRRDDRGGLRVRVIEYTLDDPARVGCGERHRLITDLLDDDTAAYPALELIVLYHQRWEIEIANDEITTHQLARPVELRSRTPAGVVQEVYGTLLAHNAVRLLMAEAARPLEVDPRTLSFMNAVRVIRETVQAMRDAPTSRLPLLYQAMLHAIILGRLPPRDGRINPRVVKVIRPSNFPVKKPDHHHWPQPRGPFVESVVMLK